MLLCFCDTIPTLEDVWFPVIVSKFSSLFLVDQTDEDKAGFCLVL